MSVDERLEILRSAKPLSWLAFSSNEDRLVASAETFESAAKLAAERGENDPVLTFVPQNWNPAALAG
jgi:hypothetical protein